VCESPPAVDPGVVCVELGVNARDFLDSGHSFEYTLGPEISSIQPSFGSETGGKAVRLSGSFANSSQFLCFFGDASVAGKWVSNEEIICAAPKLQPGNYSISVSLNSVDMVESPLDF
jgi:hypothetical protein